MSKPQDNSELRDKLREFKKGDTGISTIIPDFAIDQIIDMFAAEREKLLDELEKKHQETCGATEAGDHVNRCEYPRIIASQRRKTE